MKVRELQHLAAAMAHEVRNPLNSMAIHLELLEGRLRKESIPPGEREALRKSAQVLGQEIVRVDKILDEYLAFAGPEEASRQPVDAVQLVSDAVKRVRPQAEAAGIGVEVRAAADLGRWAVDAEALGEAIDALLVNAIQASPRGAVVEIAPRTSDEHAEIAVVDRGEGIAKEDLPRVFRIGFSRRGRPGIGLTVAKQIVKGHGGSIAATANDDVGTTFVIRMPLEVEHDDDA